MSVKSTTTYYNLVKFRRGHSVRDIDLGNNMDLIDAALHDIDMGSSTMETSADPALNAAVSTAIIDANSGVIITLTGSGNAQTLQSPTTTTAGRKFTVVTDDGNTTYTIEVNGITMSAGEAQRFVWDGSAWIAITSVDADDIAFTPAGDIAATEVQAAIEEVDTEKMKRITSVDNEITRFDSTGGDVQGYSSGAPTISDTGNIVATGGIDSAPIGGNTPAAGAFTQVKHAKGADVASATPLVVLADGNYFDVTGAVQIDSINAIDIGTEIVLHFDSTPQLTNSADLVMPTGASITAAAGDEATFVEYAAGDWRCISYTRADGSALAILEGSVEDSMIEGLTAGQIILGVDGTAANNLKSVLSGDVTMDATGAVTVGADKILPSMRNIGDYIEFLDDFIGTAPDAVSKWSLNDTSSGGTPTQVYETDETAVTLACDATDEVQVCGYDFGDNLQFDIDNNPIFIARFKVPTITTNEEAVIGMGAAWNDTLDTNAAHAWFRLKANMDLLLETDDGTVDESEDSTVDMSADTYLWVKIDFADTADVLFYTGTDGKTWAARAPKTFNVSNYTAGLQPMFAILKSTGTTTPSISVDVLKIIADRP